MQFDVYLKQDHSVLSKIKFSKFLLFRDGTFHFQAPKRKKKHPGIISYKFFLCNFGMTADQAVKQKKFFYSGITAD